MAVADGCVPLPGCGGDILDSWQIRDYCSPQLSTRQLTNACPGALATIADLQVSGTWTFNADDTTATTFSMSFSEKASFPAGCYTQAQCDSFEANLKTDAQVNNVVCTYGADAGCACAFAYSVSQQSTTDRYQLSGTTLTTMSASETAGHPSSYCVSGNSLTISSSNAAGQTVAITLAR